MSKKWFTADYHLGHENIIKLCKRPFKNSRDMDRQIIEKHNSVVGKNDHVYICGDFSMYTVTNITLIEKYLRKLNGIIHLIMGNHDIKNPKVLTEAGFHSVHYPYLEVEEIICVHDPSYSVTDRSRKFVGGHVHDLFVKQKNFLNVGVDVQDFYPIDIETVRKEFSSTPET